MEQEQPQPSSAPASKSELLEHARRQYAALEQTIAELSEQQMTDSLAGGWSIKDHLAHIAAWQQILLEFHIGGKPFHEAVPDITANYATDHIDTINDAFYRRDRELPLAEVLANFRRMHQRTLATIEGMSEAELLRMYTPAGRDPSSAGQLINWIAGDTDEHYAEHNITIRKLTGLDA
jgi:hypothetical protein